MSSLPPVSKNAILKLKTAKHVAPQIFTNKSPKFHADILDFLDDAAKFKVATIFRGAGKTTVVNKIDAFSDILYEHEPYHQIFSSTEKKAKKFLKDVKTMLVNAIAKGYHIEKGSVWSDTEIEIIVDGKYKCYVEALGAGQDPRGGSFNFMRPTKQTFDDIESKVGQYAIRSRENRKKLWEWFTGDCLPALDPIVGKARVIGTILHADSLISKILKIKKWSKLIIPIIIDNKSAWSDRFPLSDDAARAKEREYFETHGKVIEIESIESIKRGLFEQGQHNLFYQEYLCVAQAEEKTLFKREYFNYFSHLEFSDKVEYMEFANAKETQRVAIREPKNIVLKSGEKIPLSSCVIYSTMDLASDGADKSVIITSAYDTNGNMYVIDISAGHWTPYEKSLNAIRVQREFNPIRFGIEKAGAQNDFFYTIDVAQKESGVRIPVEELRHGGVNKNIRISNLHPLFLTNKIFFNDSDINVAELEAQLSGFDIDVESLHDDLMDTLAYQLHFIVDRTFEEDEEEDEESTW
ncbi:MAG: hypothetical protein GQ570_15105 [Helicobacteraceae bacterium]|nr:hypothetical protein [Helicobacteraceae bacterium]